MNICTSEFREEWILQSTWMKKNITVQVKAKNEHGRQLFFQPHNFRDFFRLESVFCYLHTVHTTKRLFCINFYNSFFLLKTVKKLEPFWIFFDFLYERSWFCDFQIFFLSIFWTFYRRKNDFEEERNPSLCRLS
jgi:hypothetical protein